MSFDKETHLLHKQIASTYTNIRKIKRLVEDGADTLWRNSRGLSSIDIAIKYNNKQALYLLINNLYKSCIITQLKSNRNLNEVYEWMILYHLIVSGTESKSSLRRFLTPENVKLRDHNGTTLLHFAVLACNYSAIADLLHNGADQFALNDRGESVLNYASSWGDDIGMLYLLKKWGLIPNPVEFKQKQIQETRSDFSKEDFKEIDEILNSIHLYNPQYF